jgi:hypothetical protein
MFRHLDRTALVGALAVAAGLVACDQAPTAPGATDVASSATSSQASDAAPLAAQGVTYAATGAGQQWSTPPGEGMKPALRRFTFTAQKKADGTVTGHYNIVAASGLHIEGAVTCLNVVDGRAWIGGTFRNAQPAPPFTPVGVAFEVLDGGLGPSATDQISNLGIFAAELGATEENVQDFCDDAIPGPVSPIDLGSVMVE